MMKPTKFRGAWIVAEADGMVNEAGVFSSKKEAQKYCDNMNSMLSNTLSTLNIHWLAITRKKPLAPIIKHKSFATRDDLVKTIHREYNLPMKNVESFKYKSYITIPRKAFVEIVHCDCTDGSHSEELK